MAPIRRCPICGYKLDSEGKCTNPNCMYRPLAQKEDKEEE